MKLHIVYNKDGEILGAAVVSSGEGVRARPVADEKAGHRAAEVEVPAEHQHLEPAAIFQKLRVHHVDGEIPQLKAKE